MPLLPATTSCDNYAPALTGSERGAGSAAPVAPMMWVSLVIGARHRDRQDRDLAAVGLRHRLLPLPVPQFVFWAIFVTLMLPVEVRIVPTYQVVSDLGMLNTLRGPDDSADRLGHRDLPVPPVLPDGAGRAGGGRAHGRRRADALLQGRAAAAVGDLHRGAVRDPVHLRLEPVPVAAAGDHRREHVPGRDRHQADDHRRRGAASGTW